MKRIAVCDDIQEIARSMQIVLRKHTFDEEIVVDAFTSGTDLLESVIRCRYDIIFMDIELDPEDQTGYNGMTVSSKIKNLSPEVIFIFFTGNLGYEKELLSFEPFRYLCKPVQAEQMICAVKDAMKRINHWVDNKFYFKRNRVIYTVRLNDILFFASSRPYIEIRTFHDHITFREKMDNVEREVLQMTDNFYRVNKSYLVNSVYVRTYTAKEIIMETGDRISASRTYMKRFADYIGKEGRNL